MLIIYLRASLKTHPYPSLLEKGRDEANKKTVFRDALKIIYYGKSGFEKTKRTGNQNKLL